MDLWTEHLEHPNIPQTWNIQINGSMDLWKENLDIQIYGQKIWTYKCASNLEHTNQWFNGWNIVTHRYRAHPLEHIDVQQKVTFKNMVSRREYLHIHICSFTF